MFLHRLYETLRLFWYFDTVQLAQVGGVCVCDLQSDISVSFSLSIHPSIQEQLQRQLQEANRKAQEYRQQLMCKEQEAEQYRMKLEAMSHSHTNGTSEQEEVVGGEEEEVQEEVMLQEGDIIIKTEELDSVEEQVTLVDSAPSHTEVIS